MSRRLALAIAIAACGCRPLAPQPEHTVERGRSRPTPATTPATPALLSAHLSVVDAPTLGGLDALELVFSSEVDAASLHPRVFLVVLDDGSRVRPLSAALAPANESDENRTVVLVGELCASIDHPPTDVAVAGPLYAESGPSFYGASAKIEPYSAPDRVVTAVRIASDDACPGAAQAVRTYWSDALRGIDDADLSRVRVRLADGGEVSPAAFADRDGNLGEAGEDNVLDLCIEEAAPARRLRVEAGVFTDPAGHASAAVDLPIESGDATQ